MHSNGNQPETARTPMCPRCGYDLRGTVATWDDGGACPLDGTCTECGLTFCWADVFDPTREEPQWCVEYAPGRGWPMAKAMVGTFARSWLPWVFWKRLRLHHRVNIGRLAAYALVCMITPVMVALPGALILMLMMRGILLERTIVEMIALAVPPTIVWLTFQFVYLLTFVLLPITRRRTRSRGIHFIRIALYGVALPSAQIALALILIALLWIVASPFVASGLAFDVAILLVTAFPLTLLLIWWYCAIHFHLRLPHPLAVTLVMAVLTILLMVFLGPATVLFLLL